MSTSSHASTAQAACEVQTIVELHTLDSATPEHSSLTDSLVGNEAWRQYQTFFCIFLMNFAMATLGLKEMGKFLQI